MVSWPACACHESGGSPAASRVASTALAFVPAPPATAALTNFSFGYFCSKILTMAARPSASPGPTHHEKTSTFPLPAAVVAVPAGASVAAVVGAGCISVGAVVGASVAAGVPQAASTVAAIISMATRPYENFLGMVFFSYSILTGSYI